MTHQVPSQSKWSYLDWTMCGRCAIGKHYDCTGMRKITGQSDRHCECKECMK